MAKSKKLLTSAIALGTAAALTLGGTFAWQSISQMAVDESSNIVNPGGRLHNDQWFVSSMENNNDIYVENFTTKDEDGNALGTPIYARVKLEEYMEIVMNYGTAAQKVQNVVGLKLDKETGEPLDDQNVASSKDGDYDYGYVLHNFGGENATDDWWTWITATSENTNRPYYMPTFNTNKDSLAADLNGQYVEAVGGITNREQDQYRAYEIWKENSTKEGYEIWDFDSDLDDELKDLSWDELNAVIGGDTSKVEEYLNNRDIKLSKLKTHTAQQVGETKGLISMSDWLNKRNNMSEEDKKDAQKVEETLGKYWVYDTDGWVYWSSPIGSGETTGLLLDGMKLNGVMDDTWYYDVKVTAQFVTANDVGKYNGTGFYSDGDTVTTNAEILLKAIGVDMDTVVMVTELSQLKDEIANAKDGDNIVVDKNITIRSAESITFSGKNDDGSNKQLTLTLNGHTIQRSSGKVNSSPNTFFIIADGVDLTIDGTNGGGMRCDTTNLRGMCAKNGATINVVGGGEYMGSVIAACAYGNSTINIYAGTWRMRGNDLKFASNYIRTYNNGRVNIYGGTLISKNCIKGNVKIATGSTLGAATGKVSGTDAWYPVTSNE